MTTDNTIWHGGLQRKYAALIATCLILIVVAATYLLCQREYVNERRELLAAQEESMAVWISGTARAISLWGTSLGDQAKRISASELYRLFASEVGQMDAKSAAVLNDPDASALSPSEDASVLTEQIPLMRNVLLDFMNYNGLTDARIVNAAGQTLLSSLSRPTPVTPAQIAAVNQAMNTDKTAFAPVHGSPAGLSIDYADPLRPVMTDENADKPVAALLLTAPVTGQIAQFLARDRRGQGTVSPRLLQRFDSKWEEIRVSSPEPVPVVDAQAAPNAEGVLDFGMRDALDGNNKVYSLGIPVQGMNWCVVLEASASEINERLQARALTIYGMGALGAGGFILLLALLWWVAVGREHAAVARRFEGLYRVIEQQKRLLDSVNVSLEVGLLMADENGQIQISNRAFSRIVKREEAELSGMTLASLFDGVVLGQLMERLHQVVRAQETTSFEIALNDPEGERLFRVTLFPFVDSDQQRKGVVAIFQDITEFRRNSRLRSRQQKSAMSALVRAIEGVDPYLAGHSRMMESLGGLIGQKLTLDEKDCATIRTSASLSQVGKLFVPRELLSKTGQLTPEEQTEMARVPEYAYNVLSDIDFDLPVARAVHEMYERMDGSGHPRGLSGEDISLHARVLAVVNAFAAMVSPRSYRAGMPIDSALKNLRSNTNSFDQSLVDALEAVLHTPEGAQAATGREDNE